MATPMADDLKRAYHRTWWALMLRGLLGLVLGVFIFLRPLDSVAAFALVIAFWALFTGIAEILNAFELARVVKHWWVLLVSGLVAVGFGILALIYYPLVSLGFAVAWVSLWLLVTGILAIYAAYWQRKYGLQWGWTGAAGVLAIVASGSALLVPSITLAVLMGLIAGFGVVSGVVLITGALKLHKLAHA